MSSELFTNPPIELVSLLIVIYFLYGAVMGSFLNVCIIRIPQKRSVAYPPSTCICGTRIKWYDNIPIVSWILLRGRSRCCNNRISCAYPIVEAIIAIGWAMCAYIYTIEISWVTFGLSIMLCTIIWLKVYFVGVHYNIFNIQ